MGDVTRVGTRVFATGKCYAAANAPEELSKVVAKALQGSIRLAPYVDKDEFANSLVASGIAADVAHMIAQTGEITDDDAYFTDDWPK